MIDYEAKARELRKEHQKTCSNEQLVIRYGLRTAEEAQRQLDARFDERCAAALREAVEAEREACATLIEARSSLTMGACEEDWTRHRHGADLAHSIRARGGK